MDGTRTSDPPAIDAAGAWRLLLALRARCRDAEAPQAPLSIDLSGAAPATIEVDAEGAWRSPCAVSAEAAELLDLYLPFARASRERPMTVGHLGQSLDGRIATEQGQSHYITGEDNIVHLHRMRALADAVVVGASTVEADDPRLTTRHVEGPNPVRVIIDPQLRLPGDHALFRDGAAPTCVVCRSDAVRAPDGGQQAAELLPIEPEGDDLSVAAIVARLRAEGLAALFVEGGGITVSHFLAAGCLDRLQIAIAPMILGSGRPAIQLPPIASLDQALRLDYRSYRMGDDLLLDCDLRGAAGQR